MTGTLSVIAGGVETLKSEMKRVLLEGIRSNYVRRLGEIALERGVSGDQITDIYTFLKSTFLYQPDPVGRELLISPARFAEDYVDHGIAHRGDCDDLAVLVGSVLGSLGYDVRILVVSYNYDWEHAYAEVRTSIGWLPVDLASTFPLGWDTNPTRISYVTT